MDLLAFAQANAVDRANGPDLTIETALTDRPVAGIDEAGRGPWAGPVVAAAVVLDRRNIPIGLNDSKKLAPAARERLFDEIMNSADVGVALSGVEDIARNNVLGATFHAMQRAFAALCRAPRLAIVDGPNAPALPCPAHPVVKGDQRSLSIAAASIIAKVTRDRLMETLAQDFPGYGWERNKGYGTAEHAAALRRLGVTPHHRLSFKPIQKILSRNGTSAPLS